MLEYARDFFKDRLAFIIGYLLNTLLLVLFFNLVRTHSLEIIYPVMISAFILVLVLIIQWFQHYRYTTNISRIAEQPLLELPLNTAEQKKHYELFSKIHLRYLKQFEELQLEDRNFRRFLAQWVHYMKSPVTVTDLILQKAKENPGNPEIILQNIQEENNRILEGLEQVLSLIRLEEFSKDYSPSTTNLLEDIRTVINQRKNQFIYQRIYPKIVCEQTMVPVLTDSKWNCILLDQLVSNAIKYSANGENKTLTILVEDCGNRIHVILKDQGIGIPEYDLKKVFEPFFTGENGRITKGSTGIGLFLCRQISDRLGHTLSIQSEVHQGTTVTIGYLKSDTGTSQL